VSRIVALVNAFPASPDVTPLRHAHRLRSLLPRSARERLYDWHPNRARRWKRHPGIERVAPAGHAVLTLDDGPDDDATVAVLDAMDAAAARGTFFLVAEQLAAHPEIGREIVRRGHEVGLHGFRHQRHDRIEPEQSRADVLDGFEAVHAALGVRPRWYRPPFGKMSDASMNACSELSLTPVYWSAWGHDWESVSAERIADLACQQLDDGGILLLHDSARYGRRASAIPTAEAIGRVADWARDRGLTLTSLGETAGS
jgi:peptidoglycan/xylan/chitin deacetylase (PgdA/CDA1 family)